ncbi:MAG: hypothetical protein KDA60_17255, partial [Planctomycetales bacterium]|nr:hypothetical protein [Planctomycetales bacterium]
CCEPTSVYTIQRTDGLITIEGPEGPFLTEEGPYQAKDTAEFLHTLESDVVIRLQKRRPDLLFVHAGAVERQGRVHLFVAESGSGKSTTVWALIQNGFRYLSDELAPLRLDQHEVYPYPHAICLKQEPAAPFALPSETLRTSTTMHVPTDVFSVVPEIDASYPLATLWFVEHDPRLVRPEIRTVSPAEAAARLYANVLNPLAHPGAGLDAAVQAASGVPGFFLNTAELQETCELVRTTIQQVIP